MYASVWRSVTDGSVGLVFVTWTGVTRTITYTLDPAIYGLPSRGVTLFRLDEQGAHQVQRLNGITQRSETLPPRTILVLAAATCPTTQTPHPGLLALPACSQHLPLILRGRGDSGDSHRTY